MRSPLPSAYADTCHCDAAQLRERDRALSCVLSILGVTAKRLDQNVSCRESSLHKILVLETVSEGERGSRLRTYSSSGEQYSTINETLAYSIT
jgi:hypothetical protein